MNKIRIFTLAAVAAMAIGFLSCSSGDVKSTGNALIDSLNVMLAKVPIDGYQSGQAASKAEWNRMITAAVPVVKEVLPKIPAGFKLQVTGHTDSQGGTTSQGNMALSAQRAQQVFQELRKRGITDPKLVSKGVGGTIVSGKCSDSDSCQRRVTFIVVQ